MKLRWDKINALKTYCTETKFYKKMMHFCAITKSKECSLLACFESLQCPKIVLTVIKKDMFFKSFRGAAPDPAWGAYSAPLDPQLVFTWAAPLFVTVRRPCLSHDGIIVEEQDWLSLFTDV